MQSYLLENQQEDPISSYLPKPMGRQYLRLLGQVNSRKFAERLRSTPRWVNDGGIYKKPQGFQENLLDHIQFLLAWLNDIEQKYPQLFKEVFEREQIIDPTRLRIALIIHDIGETVRIKTRDGREIGGDISRSHPEFDKKAGRIHKKRESRFARLLLKNSLPEEQAVRILELLHFYEQKKTDHKPSLLGQILDKGHGAHTFGRTIVPANLDNPDLDLQARARSGFIQTITNCELLAEKISSKAADQLRKTFQEKVLSWHLRINNTSYQKGVEEMRDQHPFFFR